MAKMPALHGQYNVTLYPIYIHCVPEEKCQNNVRRS